MDILVKAYDGGITPLNCPFNGCTKFSACPGYEYHCGQDKGQ